MSVLWVLVKVTSQPVSAVSGLALSITLIYLLAYLSVISSKNENHYTAVSDALRALVVPLIVTFFAVVIFETLNIIL